MQGKLSTADWKRIENALAHMAGYILQDQPSQPEYKATLDRIQFHNKTGPYALKLVH